MKYVELLNGIQDEWSIKEKARYLYENLCKNISYDERFAYSQNTELLRKIYYREVDIRKDEDERFICHSSNKIYFQLLSQLGIKCKLIYKKSAVRRPIDVQDVALVFWDENENKYYTNIVGDIQNCRFGLRTKYFGIKKNSYEEAQDVQEIFADELKEIDIKTGTIQTDYNDMVFGILANEVKHTNNFKKFLKGKGLNVDNMSHEDILKNKLYYLNKLIKFRDRTAGPDEMKKFYQHLFSTSVLDKFESKKFNTYEFIKENDKDVKVLSVIEIDMKEEPIYYVYSEQEQTYIQLLSDEINEKIRGYREKKGKKLLIQEKENREYKGEEL